MKYNLMEEAWIPVRTRTGLTRWIRPDEIVADDPNDPFVAFSSSRPDFNAGLLEFMIGLLQTCFAPEDMDEWKELYDKPPSSTDLKTSFSKYKHAFELMGDGPRFLQDFEPLDSTKRPIRALLIDAPAANALKLNKDHFIKRDDEFELGPASTALALFTLQAMAPSGGAGHRTSMRGGGPWITVLQGPTLWKTLWINTLDDETFEAEYPASHNKPHDIFPWLAPTQTSERKTGKEVMPTDASPLQAYWGMPRRIRLAESTGSGVDSIRTQNEPAVFKTYETKNYGINYSSEWRHPLTPYRFEKQVAISTKGSSHALSFRHWSQYTFSDNESQQAALVVRTAQQRIDDFDELSKELRLFAGGYDMDNMKARCWYQGTMPFLQVKEQYRELVESICDQLIEAIGEVVYSLDIALKHARYGRLTQDASSGKLTWSMGDLPSQGSQRLREWANKVLESRVEPEFYQIVQSIIKELERGKTENALNHVKEQWLSALSQTARNIFDEQVSSNSPVADHSAIAQARSELHRFVSPRSKRLRTKAGLPPLEKGVAS